VRGQVGTIVEQFDNKTVLVEFNKNQSCAFAIARCPEED
jgi:hypothetical protein